MQELPGLVSPLLTLCRRAGEVICWHYHLPGDADVLTKVDDSPLTQADLDSHELLEQGLTRLLPGLPVLSEESTQSGRAQRRTWRTFWLVDPLDGTREFLERTGEFTINVALIRDQRPVFGMIYLPLRNLAYVGIPGAEAALYTLSDQGRWSARELAGRPLVEGELTLLASRRHRGPRFRECLAWLESRWGPVRRRNSGSALKFCHLADGLGDIYPRFSPCCEWDTAAGDALVEAAGGKLMGMDGAPLRYNARDSLLSPNFYAVADPAQPLWERLLRENFGDS